MRLWVWSRAANTPAWSKFFWFTQDETDIEELVADLRKACPGRRFKMDEVPVGQKA